MLDRGVKPNDTSALTGRRIIALVLLAFGLTLAVRATGPEDLTTRDQERVAAYVLDITENQRWLLQHDFRGNVASKPPLTNWLAATASLAAGRVERIWLGFPSWFATALTCLGIAVATSWFAGRRAALLAVPLFLFSQLGLRQIYLVRSDPLFQCGVFFGAMAVFRWWTEGKGHLVFALSMTAAVLAKGPHAFAFGLAGLAAVIWDHRQNPRGSIGDSDLRHRFPPLRTTLAIVLPLAVPVLWFLLANWSSGGAAWSKLIDDELIGHAAGKGDRTPFERPLHPWGWFLTRAAPMGPVALLAILALIRRPQADPDRRRLERFLTCWILGVLVLLTVVGNKRFIHLLPALPPAAILAARYLDQRLPRLWHHHAGRITLGITLGAAALAALYLNVFDNSRDLRKAEAVREITDTIESRLGRDFPLFVGAGAPDLALVALDRFSPMVGSLEIVPDPEGPNRDRLVIHREASLDLLRSDAAVYLLTDAPEFFEARLGNRVRRVLEHSGDPWEGTLAIVSNRDRLEWPREGSILTPGGRRISTLDAQILRKTNRVLEVRAERSEARLTIERDALDGTNTPSDRETVPLLPMQDRQTPCLIRTSIDGDSRRKPESGLPWFLILALGSLGLGGVAAARRIDAGH
ncbi:MAG: hypothetical protein AAF196_18880 [Planctomycetota bacterium]